MSQKTTATNKENINKLLKEFKDVFSEELGKYNGPPIHLALDPNIAPKIFKARRPAYAILPKIEEELQRLQQQGVLEPISHPKWATPMVPIIKSDGSVRICGDYKVTLNTALKDDIYPVSAALHVLAVLGGAKLYGFANIDVAQAYQQLEVDDETAEAQTIITHKGAFRIKRLQYGIKTALQIF